MVQMGFNLKDQFVDNYNTNIFVATFTTSHACEMLYEELDKLGGQVLGYDTDSCWYVDRPGGNTIDTGDSLGDLTGRHGPKILCVRNERRRRYYKSKRLHVELLERLKNQRRRYERDYTRP